jgi:hypothetical protein
MLDLAGVGDALRSFAPDVLETGDLGISGAPGLYFRSHGRPFPDRDS